KRGRLFAAAQLRGGPCKRLGKSDFCVRSVATELQRARSVRRQLERGQSREPVLPIHELFFEHRALQTLTLPHGKVSILDRQHGQVRLASADKCVIAT